MSDTQQSEETPMRAMATMFEWEPGIDCIVIANTPDAIRQITAGREIGEIHHVAVTVGPAVMEGPTPDSFAAQFDGRQYGNEVTPAEEIALKAAGMVAVFGYSDDCTEFRGAIRDEVGLGELRLGATGKIIEEEAFEALKSLVADGTIAEMPPVKFIHATHGIAGHRYTTDIPHAEFTIYEDGDVFGRGLVFRISDLK